MARVDRILCRDIVVNITDAGTRENMTIRRFVFALLSALGVLSAAAPAGAQSAPTLVFAAASLTDVLQDIGKSYEAASGTKVAFSFAGSMALAKQIEASTGADIFISADSDSMDYVDSRGLLAKGSRKDLLGNDLVIVAPRDAKIALKIAPGFKLADALAGGRLAVANTDTVPAGRYAKAALTKLGVWDSVADHLAQGDDVRTTLAFVARGEAPLGIVYATDARVEPKVKVVGVFAANSYPPIIYPAALTKEAKPDAAAFLRYLSTPQARTTFAKAGFIVLAR